MTRMLGLLAGDFGESAAWSAAGGASSIAQVRRVCFMVLKRWLKWLRVNGLVARRASNGPQHPSGAVVRSNQSLRRPKSPGLLEEVGEVVSTDGGEPEAV